MRKITKKKREEMEAELLKTIRKHMETLGRVGFCVVSMPGRPLSVLYSYGPGITIDFTKVYDFKQPKTLFTKSK